MSFPDTQSLCRTFSLKTFYFNKPFEEKKEISYHIFDILHSFWLLLCYRVKDIEAEEYMTYV